MRILFVLKGLALVRHFEEMVERLAADGHTIILAPYKTKTDTAPLPDSLARLTNCTVVPATCRRQDGRELGLGVLRMTRDYLRYVEPPLWGAPANRRRALTRLVRLISEGTVDPPPDTPDVPCPLTEPAADRLSEAFRQLESFVPADDGYSQFLRAQRADLLLISPLVNLGGRQAEFIKAARYLGVPSAVLVFSWDNLSNKGVMHEIPDRVFVWNEIQRGEATTLHRVEPEAVIATGAPRFDAFYRFSASRDRESFCREVHLDARAPLVVYLGSSPAVTPNEPLFAKRWIEAIRGSSGRARDAQLLVRPHPRSKRVWLEHPRFADGAPGDGVALMAAKSVQSDQGLFDALNHADAVVGLNTSAEIEAGILGKPVYTIRTPDLAPGQTGSLHFHYLLRSRGGFVHEAETLNQHLSQLEQGLAGAFDQEGQRVFVQQFVRPRGAATPASGVLADEILAFAQGAVRPGWRRWVAEARHRLRDLARRV